MGNPFVYSLHSKIKFGQYYGIRVGIIFLFDPEYIEWLIEDNRYFSITDLNELEKNGVINKSVWAKKFVLKRDPIPFMKMYKSYTEFIEKSELQEYEISDYIKDKNLKNRTGHIMNLKVR